MQLDPGYALSLAPVSFFKRVCPDVDTQPTNVVLSTYTGETMHPLGEAYVKVEYSGLQHSLPFLVVQEGTSALFGWNWLVDKNLLLVALLVHDTWCLIAKKKVPWLNRLVILSCRCFCRSVLLALCWFSCLQNHVWIFLLLFISLFTKSVKKLTLSTLEAFWWAHWHVHRKCTSRVNIMPFSHAIFHQLYVDWDMHLVRK